jgi:hypothetical protein
MPTLSCYVDERTLAILQRAAEERCRTVEDLAECAIAEAAIREVPRQPARVWNDKLKIFEHPQPKGAPSSLNPRTSTVATEQTVPPPLRGSTRMVPQRCIASVGEAGDCYSACIATILGVPIASVPNFNEETRREGLYGEAGSLAMTKRAVAYLRPFGLSIFNSYCNGEWPIEKALEYFSGHSPGVPVIFHGKPRFSEDEAHAVIALDGKIVHDPSGAGIAGPLGDWWFMDVIALAASCSDEPPASHHRYSGGDAR